MDKLYKDKIEELNLLNLFQLGDIYNKFGKKYKNYLIKDIYNEDKLYLEWVKKNTTEINIKNENSFELEYSRKALILFYDMMNILTKK